MAEESQAIVKAIESLNQTTKTSQAAQEEYFKNLAEKIDGLSQALVGRTSDKEDNRRFSNAYNRRMSDFSQLPPEQQKRAYYQYTHGVRRNPETGQYESATGTFSLRRNVGELNIPRAKALLEEGHLEQAGAMFVTGLVKSPLMRPFALGTEARLGAQTLDFARNRVIAQRLGQPNALGMATGARGPGVEDLTSGFGSFVASLTAFPSMFANKTGQPFGLFGTEMAPAVSRGYQMRQEAFKRSLNPFSMMGYKQNLELLEATGSKGFGSTSQTFKVSDVARDLMQSVGMDAGTILDTLDIAVKRLDLDVGEAAKQMKEFGLMATSAGKGVAQFSKETFEVLNQMSLQGARGPGALTASALMSSIPQVAGPGVYQALTSPTTMGLMMGGMGGKTNLSSNAQILAATGNAMAINGGQSALATSAKLMQSFQNTVDTLMPQFMAGVDPNNENEVKNAENAALSIVMPMFGISDITAAQQMYRQSGRFIKQAKALQKIQGAAAGFKNPALSYFFGGGGSGRKVGELAGAGKSSYEIFKKSFTSQTGKGIMTGVGSGMGTISLKDPTGAGNDLEFNMAVNRLVNAKRFNQEDVEVVKTELQNQGLDLPEIIRASDLIISAGAGGKSGSQSYAKLFENFGATALGVGERPKHMLDAIVNKEKYRLSGLTGGVLSEETWKQMGANGGEGQKQYINRAMSVLNQLSSGKDAILKKGSAQYQSYETQIKSGKFDFDKFQQEVITTGALSTQALQDQHGRPIVQLTQESVKGIGQEVKLAMENKLASDREP